MKRLGDPVVKTRALEQRGATRSDRPAHQDRNRRRKPCTAPGVTRNHEKAQSEPTSAAPECDGAARPVHSRDVETLGDRLRRMRGRRGLTQAAVAKVAGTTESYVSRLEAGIETNPSAKVVAGLADALKTSTDWLLGRTAA